ncbi:PHP domain-containing protein [Candidatus Stoquefichus massiliensis]|uniref:PHP domain-containing protein n=1 Tax=Candidatus Stoquefichus massiliensis TaxID=1470350 RepID=UPI0004863D23|nr:PHP domain-containing protein [Candidatus Stoquefichus massiliensis]
MDKFIDLHMHSLYSDDGEFTPTELVNKCYQAGIRIMAIADHNSVKAIDEAKKVADELQIKYIPAVEIDCTYEGINLHVLGYGINYHHKDFIDLEENVLQQELSSSLKKIDLTNALGFHITKNDLDKVSDNGVYTGEMFAEVLLNMDQYKDHELLLPYREGGTRSDNPYVNFYWDYYAQGKPCYTEIIYPTLKETIDLIHRHGGKAVLAHPGNNLKGQFGVFDEMMKLGYDGVECFSNYHNPETVEYFYQKGQEYHIMTTCGSDYHGKTKPAIELGECRCIIDECIIEKQLKENFLI